MCFDGKLRTDKEFLAQVDEDFHVGSSILIDISNFGRVSNVPLDYMHVVCLGVVKKLLKIWIPLPHRSYKKSFSLSTAKVQELSMKSCNLQNSHPCEFARKLRSLDEINNWKVTEFCNFLLYLGPALLFGIVSVTIYPNFLTFHVAILILASEKLNEYAFYADNLLKIFVSDFAVFRTTCIICFI